MGKKRSGRIGGIRLEVKNGSDTVQNAPSGPNAQKAVSSQTNVTKVPSGESITVELDYETPLEKLMNRANDIDSIKAFAQSWNKEVSEKLALREVNVNVSYEEFERRINSKKLDANLKKCTAFVRKIRQYTESQKPSIETDIKSLNLSKYLTEITSAITEARFKMEHIQDVVVVSSWMHQRYADFSAMLLDSLKKAFPTKKSEMTAAVLSKLSVDLRLIGDLVICGVLPVNEGCHMLSIMLRNMIGIDKEGVQCLIPITSFCLGLSDSFLGEVPRRIYQLCMTNEVILIRSNVLPPEKKVVFRVLIKEYFNVVCSALLKCHHEQQKSELYNRKLLRTRGEIPSDRKEDHLVIKAKFEKYSASAEKFSDAINELLPQLSLLPADPEEEEEKALLISETGEFLTTVPGIVLFDDEETRAFYQDFKDLKVYLPPVAYRESIQQTAEQTQAIEEREKALDDFDDEAEAAELENENSVAEDDVSLDTEVELDLLPSMRNETEEKEIDKQIKPNFQVFLNQLPNCVNRNMIDKAAFEFAETHNNKPNRKKLVQTLFRVPRQRMDLLSFYGRFVAILNPVMPEIGLELCQLLKNDFRFLVRKKHQIFIETKVKVVRFIGELVNFRIFPKSDALQCFKTLLMDFVHHQIEMACVFVETCGRVLYRTPDSHRRMKIYLEEMMRKKTVKSIEARYSSMIDHAYHIVLPREDAPRTERKKSAIELYLESFLIDNLRNSTLDKACTVIRSLDLEDTEVYTVVTRLLSSPWRITSQQIRLQGQLLAAVLKTEPFLVTRVIDLTIEDIRRGVENPYVDFNHRRFSTLQYLTELYYYRLIKSDTIFDVLYLLITFGVSWDPTKPSSCDPPDNLSRVRHASFLLKECGDFINRGSNKKKMRLFLLHLQKYYWLKRSHPMWLQRRFPYGIFELWEEIVKRFHPKMVLAQNVEEAEKALCVPESEDEKGKNLRLMPISETIDLDYFKEDIKTRGLPQKSNDKQHTRITDSDNVSNSECDNGTGTDGQVDPNENEMDIENDNKQISVEDEEFINMFEKMCSEVNYSAARDGGKHMKSDIAIPLHISNSAHSTSSHTKDSTDDGSTEKDYVPFVLITRKGNKQQYKTLPLPANSDFVRRIKSREEMEREEKESVKRRTLAISQLQEAEEREMEREALKNMFVTVPVSKHKT